MPSTTATPTPTPNPVQQITREFGLTLPEWAFLGLSLLAAIALLLTLYKPLLEAIGKVWRLVTKVHGWRRSNTKRARRRIMFADHLESSMRRLAEKEEWRDSRFAELEAEVEVERQAPWNRLRRKLGGAATTRIRRLPSLTVALEQSAERLVVLEGDPGAGKSVALRHMAQTMAATARRRHSDRTILPIYVNLKTFRPVGGSPSAEDVRSFVLATMNPAQSRDIDRFLDDEFDPGREDGLWLFLFDSFDEIPAVLSAVEAGPIIENYADAIAGFIGMGRSRCVIASREFRGPGRTGWPTFRVMPLTRKRRETLIRQADLNDRDERMLLDGLGGLESSVQQLADNPLFLSLLCEYVRDRKSLPTSTHAVMESYVQSRLARDEERIENLFAVPIDVARSVAEEMAFRMLSTPEIGLSVHRDQITGQLQHDPEEVAAALDALLYSKLVRQSEDDNGLTFSHRRIQEYFATCVAMRERDRITLTELLTSGRWRETAVAMLQTQDSDALLAEVETLLKQRIGADDRPIWPAGVLHLLDVLANGCQPDVEVAASATADSILEHAWEHGTRLDRKWTVELCAAAGTDRAVDYLERAFDSASMLLRDEAYVQVRRVGAAATRLEPQIRQALVDMSVGGGLRKERRSVQAQLLRLADPRPLQQTVRLLLAAPAAAFVTGLLLIPMLVSLVGTWSAVLSPVLLMLAVLSARLKLASEERQVRRLGTLLRNLQLSVLETDILVSIAPLITLGLFASLFFTVTVTGINGWTSADTTITACGAWLLVWPYGALRAAATGKCQHSWQIPLLPAYALASVVRPLPRFTRPLATRVSIMVACIAAVGGIVFVERDWIDRNVQLILAIVFSVPLLAIPPALWSGMRWVRKRQRERRFIALLSRHELESDAASSLQHVFDILESDEGVRTLLQEVRKRQLIPGVAEFLDFLAGRMEDSDDVHSRQDWGEWWAAYKERNPLGPLLHPSAATIDELARLSEDAHRDAAFRS